MPAVRKEGLFFNSSPWESFPSHEVQEVLSPLHTLGLQFGKDPGGEILLAFPIMAYEIVNDLATHRDEAHFAFLYRHVPLLSSRLLVASTKYLTEPPESWDIRRALLHWSNQLIWVRSARSSSLTPRLVNFRLLQQTIHKNCPQLRAIKADLIRRKHYYDLHHELEELWHKWRPNTEAALCVNRYYRVRWLAKIAPVLKAAEIF